MNVEIIRANGDLKREVWVFTLYVDCSAPIIWLGGYSSQTRGTTRQRKWIKQTHWERFDHRSNNIDKPLIHPDVEMEMRDIFASKIREIPIRS